MGQESSFDEVMLCRNLKDEQRFRLTGCLSREYSRRKTENKVSDRRFEDWTKATMEGVWRPRGPLKCRGMQGEGHTRLSCWWQGLLWVQRAVRIFYTLVWSMGNTLKVHKSPWWDVKGDWVRDNGIQDKRWEYGKVWRYFEGRQNTATAWIWMLRVMKMS